MRYNVSPLLISPLPHLSSSTLRANSRDWRTKHGGNHLARSKMPSFSYCAY